MSDRPVHQFIESSRAWWASDSSADDIIVSYAHHDGGCEWEFIIGWHDLGTGCIRHPRLDMFDDAWAAFTDERVNRFLTGLSTVLAGTTPSQAAVVELLQLCGFVDATPTEQPADLLDRDDPM
jgi:hypothetical protein